MSAQAPTGAPTSAESPVSAATSGAAEPVGSPLSITKTGAATTVYVDRPIREVYALLCDVDSCFRASTFSDATIEGAEGVAKKKGRVICSTRNTAQGTIRETVTLTVTESLGAVRRVAWRVRTEETCVDMDVRDYTLLFDLTSPIEDFNCTHLNVQLRVDADDNVLTCSGWLHAGCCDDEMDFQPLLLCFFCCIPYSGAANNVQWAANHINACVAHLRNSKVDVDLVEDTKHGLLHLGLNNSNELALG